MSKLIAIYVIAALLILIIDWKVMRTLPPINRWLAVILLICGLGMWSYTLHFHDVQYGAVMTGRLLKRFIPF